MVYISVERLEFGEQQKTQSFMIENNHNCSILFKVKTNNVNALDAKPSVGILESNSSIKISVKRNCSFTEQVKLQIKYTECNEAVSKESANAFKELWSKYDKNQRSVIMDTRIVKKTDSQEKKVENQFTEGHEKSGAFESIIDKKESPPPKQEQIHQQQVKTDIENSQLQNQEKKEYSIPKVLKEQAEHKQESSQIKLSPAVLALMLLIVFLIGYKIGAASSSSSNPAIIETIGNITGENL